MDGPEGAGAVETAKDDCRYSASFLHFSILAYSWSSGHNLVPTTFTLGLPSLVKHLWKCPHRHT